MQQRNHSLTYLTPLALGLAALGAGCGGGSSPGTGPGDSNLTPGQTSFESELAGSRGRDALAELGAPSADGAGASGNSASNPMAPGGRMAEVEEADIYRMDGNRLFYLNTYRGFMIFDVTNTAAPVRLSRLPVHGYPIEMFVQGNTVYALLRDALYLTQESGRVKFNRHNVSQLVSIDITDVRNPRVLQVHDIVGQLREGVSRKIENTIYVVSYISPYYWWGWSYGPQQPQQKEQAWVYSYNVADPRNVREVQRLQIFEGGGIQFNDPTSGSRLYRQFQDVAISATSNALMVVENWYVSAYSSGSASGGGAVSPGRGDGCGSFSSSQLARVSLVDVSDPTGSIRVHSRFETFGRLGDQFKMTYVHDPAARTGTFFGIFARDTWSSAGCSGQRTVRNTLESWDVTNGAQPRRLHQLDFGKPNETVHASAFDTERNLVYAITAERIDPLYAIDISDRNRLRVRSEIDGLSGNMTVFRLVGNRQFLLGIGTDQSNACAGFQDTTNWRPTNIAATLIDVRNPDGIRLVQRACVAIENAEWVGSEVTWNLDQAHKLIGMHATGDTNVLTVPVYYYRRADGDNPNWWWYQQETAVGLMAWDLTRYDDTLPAGRQNVIQNYGTVVHPAGEVRRSVVFTHSTGKRMMLNLSDTHMSVVDLQNLARPRVETVVEVAPYQGQIFGFGSGASTHIVEHIQSSPHNWGAGAGLSEFRVKPAGGDLDETPAVASFRMGGVTRVFKHGSKLVIFRRQPGDPRREVPFTNEAVVMDLSLPAQPRFAGSVALPEAFMPYYYFWCGGYDGRFGFDGESNWAQIDAGIVVLSREWQSNNTVRAKLLLLDLRTPNAPQVREQLLTSGAGEAFGLMNDSADPAGFYLNAYQLVQAFTRNGQTFQRVRYLTQRLTVGPNGFVGEDPVNLPGQLVRTWKNPAGTRLYLTQDYQYRWVAYPAETGQTGGEWRSEYRLSLLRGITRDGRALAELMDSKVFTDLYLRDIVPDRDRLYVNASRFGYWGWGRIGVGAPPVAGGDVAIGRAAQTVTSDPQAEWEKYSDQLLIFDLANLRFTQVYGAPTGTTGVQLMGVHAGQLFANLSGDGILAIDVSNPAAPSGRQFLRTLGWATHVEFAGSNAYIASGHFGVFRMPLQGPPLLARR